MTALALFRLELFLVFSLQCIAAVVCEALYEPYMYILNFRWIGYMVSSDAQPRLCNLHVSAKQTGLRS